MTQLPLFDSKPGAINAAATSKQTKRLSWYAVRDDDRLGQRQQQVLDAISVHGPISDRGLAAVLHWPINRVTPRRNELVAVGRVVQSGTVTDIETSRQVAAWVTA